MNEWSKKTVKLAKTQNYLDRLYSIYPNELEIRSVNSEAMCAIEKLFRNRDCEELLNKLLALEKFPFKDSYVSFLRKDRSAIKRNPETAKRLCETLYNLGFEKVKEGMLEPKEANRRRGQQYRNWAKTNFRHVNIDDFIASKSGIVFLEGSDKEVLDFCNIKLKLGISKRPDFVAKSGIKYLVGEAKFLSSTGGNQGRGFEDTMNLAMSTSGNAYKAAVLDGVLWIETGSQEFKKIEHANVYALSALLLVDFLRKLK
jgi:hypothetical protein